MSEDLDFLNVSAPATVKMFAARCQRFIRSYEQLQLVSAIFFAAETCAERNETEICSCTFVRRC